ncbi:GTPase [Schlesneria paludicola]|uniref:GTPase n=1 Tax=Schlesneria paludicola TaxID=360056 RepID=UPI000299DC18|nr:GTPase domain-containing protein [Schlesneria paludicola]
MTVELAQLELLAQVDDLVARLVSWSNEPSAWESVQQSQALVRRLLSRLEPLRARVEAPLVVATFGGTGVGKSSLVNGLVGQEVTSSGRQRPTTTHPIVLAHPQTDLTAYHLPLEKGDDELKVVRLETPLLRDIVLIDCPDPDTSEVETTSSNLARLHRLLPYCDVLLYVSTQQKYRSARVSEELLQAASGCRLVFIQSHADLDSDIRDDWRSQLSRTFRIADMFFVDSKLALREQQSGMRPTGEFGRLIDLLLKELSTTQRIRIRRGNLMGLVQEVLMHARAILSEQDPQVKKLEQALSEQRHRTTERMASRLQEELLVSRGLWERRLLGQVTQMWGYSPFASVLRLWHSQASLLASFSLMRSHTTAQMALVGLVHGTRWVTSQQQEQDAERRLESLSSLGLSDSELRESQIVVSGHVHAAKLDRVVPGTASFDNLRQAATEVRLEFLTDAAQRIDELILNTAKRNSQWSIRWRYEILFALLPAFLLYRVGRNFFYDSFWLEKPLLDTNFYIPSALFLLFWAGAFVMSYTLRLRRGLTRRIEELARELARLNAGAGLFPDLEQAVAEFARHGDRLDQFSSSVESIRLQYLAGQPAEALSIRQETTT